MLLYINQVMQPFGLSIAVSDNKLIPIESKFRGYSENAVDEEYSKINTYIKNNIDEITNIQKTLYPPLLVGKMA